MRLKISTTGKLTFSGRFDPLTGQIRVGDELVIPRTSGGALPAAPGIPQNLIATPLDSEADLSWDAVTGATGYKVYRDTVFLASIVAPTVTYTDSTVTNGTTYSYTVSASNTGGESAQSDPATVTPGLPVDFLLDYETGAAGDLITAVNLAASSHGAPGSYTLASHSPLEHTFISSVAPALLVPLICDSVSYSAAGTRGLKFDMDLAVSNASSPLYEGMRYTLSGTPPTEVSCGLMVRFNAVYPSELDLVSLLAGVFAIIQVHTVDGAGGFINPHSQLEDATSQVGGGISYVNNTWYWITLCASATRQTCEIAMQDGTTGALIGVSRCNGFIGAMGAFDVQDYILPGGGSVEIALLTQGFGANALFPLFSTFVVPVPASFSPAQIGNDNVHLSWTNDAKAFSYKIERNKNEGGWATIVSEQTGTTYDDTDVVDGDSVSYRVTALINALSSAPTAVESVTVNDTAGTFDPSVYGTVRAAFDHTTGFDKDNGSGGYTPVTANGDAVVRWKDGSGNSYHVTQATAGARPTYAASLANSHPGITTDGGDSLENAGAPGTIGTVFAVVEITASGAAPAVAGGYISAYGRIVTFYPDNNTIYGGDGGELFSNTFTNYVDGVAQSTVAAGVHVIAQVAASPVTSIYLSIGNSHVNDGFTGKILAFYAIAETLSSGDVAAASGELLLIYT